MESLKDLYEEKEVLKLREKELEKKIEILKQNESFEAAGYLHAILCHSNHTDRCSWFYNSWDDYKKEDDLTRNRYINMAFRLNRDFSFKEIIRFCTIIKK